MQTVKLRARVGSDGILKLTVPLELRNAELEVIVVVQSLTPPKPDVPRDELGWPLGFFERTQGALAEDPIERPPQPYITDYE